jgi:hypothetical protein
MRDASAASREVRQRRPRSTLCTPPLPRLVIASRTIRSPVIGPSRTGSSGHLASGTEKVTALLFAGLGERLARRQPASRGREGRRADAAEAEAAAFEAGAMSVGHGVFLGRSDRGKDGHVGDRSAAKRSVHLLLRSPPTNASRSRLSRSLWVVALSRRWGGLVGGGLIRRDLLARVPSRRRLRRGAGSAPGAMGGPLLSPRGTPSAAAHIGVRAVRHIAAQAFAFRVRTGSRTGRPCEARGSWTGSPMSPRSRGMREVSSGRPHARRRIRSGQGLAARLSRLLPTAKAWARRCGPVAGRSQNAPGRGPPRRGHPGSRANGGPAGDSPGRLSGGRS